MAAGSCEAIAVPRASLSPAATARAALLSSEPRRLRSRPDHQRVAAAAITSTTAARAA